MSEQESSTEFFGEALDSKSADDGTPPDDEFDINDGDPKILRARSRATTLLLKDGTGDARMEILDLRLLLQEHFSSSDLGALPSYLTGDYALLRWLSDFAANPKKVAKVLVPALRRRMEETIEIQSDLIWQGSPSATFRVSCKGATDLREASWNFCDFISVDRHGDIVVYEDWGGINPVELLASGIDLRRFREIRRGRFELLHRLLDHLSQMEQRIVRYVVVVNCKGMNLAGQ